MSRRFRRLLVMGILLLVCFLFGCRPTHNEPVTITISVGSTSEAGNAVLMHQVESFMEVHPDIKVEVIYTTESSDQQRAFYVSQLESKSSDIDIMSIDVIWAPEFGAQEWTVPLNDYMAENGIALDSFLPATLLGSTWQGKLVAMPQFIDAGMLYYRQDLLDKYGFTVPETWLELVSMAETIVAAEKETSPNLVGFVYQADEYEGLVCNYLEYVWSNDAAVFNENRDQVLLNTPESVEALEIFIAMQQIAPSSILSFKEADALNYFKGGNAVFMRNWPYAWVDVNKDESLVKDHVGFSPMPHGPQGPSGASAFGGWQLGINAYSEHPDEAFEFLAFITSVEWQSYGAIHAAQNPTRKAAYENPEVLAANPYMEELSDVFLNARPRPVHPLYANVISPIIQAEVHSALSGEKDAATATADMARQIQSVMSGE